MNFKIKRTIKAFFTACILCLSINGNAQDLLSIEDLQTMALSFEIENGELVGRGAKFLKEKMWEAQFTMLGEYHGSRKISGFTKSIIPLLHQADYKQLVLEVGPHTGKMLDGFPESREEVIGTLKGINQKYARGDGDDISLSIPFFDKVEDAEFLAEAKANGWGVLGIDQEYIDAFIMHIDMMQNNLAENEKDNLQMEFARVKDTISRLYALDNDGGSPVYTSMLKSEFVQHFLAKMESFAKNKDVVDNVRKSLEIYQMNSDGKWYENNGTRIKHMKENLRKGIAAKEFDIAKDKMLVKMGGYHMSQGFSPLGFYEVGNMLNEIAEYHGNTALNIGFLNRYWEEEDEVVDALKEGNGRIDRLRTFYTLGKKEGWMVLDLVPLRKGFYYHPQQFKLSQHEEELIQRFDILVIVPTDGEGTNNY